MAIEPSPDLVEEILQRVPAKSLALLRYTCKQWKTLIANPRFVKKHFSHMRCREQQFTVFMGSSISTVSCVGINFNEHKDPCLNMLGFQPFPSSDLSVYGMSHCDGLLLLLAMENKLLVMNPLLKQGRWINYQFNLYSDVFGLGYISNQSSSSCNDYKIVRFCNASQVQPYNISNRVEVYEFRSDSWKVIIDPKFVGFDGSPLSSVCLKGTPYWIGYEIGYGLFCSSINVSIQRFDFSKERFEPLLSSFKSIRSMDSLSLGIYKGDHLSMLHKSWDVIHIWVMKNYWNKLMTVDVHGRSIYHIYSSYFIESNSKLVVSGDNSETGSVSIYIVGENQEYSKLEHCMDCRRSYCYYVSSLLPVPGFSWREEKE